MRRRACRVATARLDWIDTFTHPIAAICPQLPMGLAYRRYPQGKPSQRQLFSLEPTGFYPQDDGSATGAT